MLSRIVTSLLALLMPRSAVGRSVRAEYRNNPSEIVVPFVAGGGTDLVAPSSRSSRQEWVTISLSQGGGGGVRASRRADRSPGDGYTVLMDIQLRLAAIGPRNAALTLGRRKYAGASCATRWGRGEAARRGRVQESRNG